MTTAIEHFSDLDQEKHWDVRGMSQEELYRSFHTLDQNMSFIYKFVLHYNDYINTRHDYTSEASLTMLEVHILTDICDQNNPTVSGLAAAWGRAVSATSQTVRRLMSKGLVTRENAPENGKVFYLHPTEKGIRVSDEHKRYDTEDTIKTVKRLMKKLRFDEIETMFKALECYGQLLQEGPQREG